MLRKSLLSLSLSLTLSLALLPQLAMAQAYPSKPIKILVPFTAGGSSDIIARSIGIKLSEIMGQPVVVENRAGANGAIPAEMIAKAPADGYSILVGP